MYRSNNPIYLTTIATEIRYKESGHIRAGILNCFLGVLGDSLVAKIDSEDYRDWRIVREIEDIEITILALKMMDVEYDNGVVLKPYEVLNDYDNKIKRLRN